LGISFGRFSKGLVGFTIPTRPFSLLQSVGTSSELVFIIITTNGRLAWLLHL
jgi:hypothetical protein